MSDSQSASPEEGADSPHLGSSPSSSHSEAEPQETSKDISPDSDGGVIKEIIKEGNGWEKPNVGDKVEVHYVGRLEDGTVFDSSRDRNEKFVFTVGKGQVIKGWEIAAKTMKRGEVAKFTLKPEYGYGEAGNPPTIPPKANLIFEIELFDWRMEDLTRKKDGGVRKQILVEGDGYSTPNEGATVEVHLVGKLGDKVFEERDVTFIVGEGCEEQVIEGVEVAVTKMKKGEKSTVFIRRDYAWADKAPPGFEHPKDYEEVAYDVVLKNFEKRKETWEMDNEERLEHAELAKTKGSAFFKQSKYALALKQYKHIPQYIGPPDNSDFEKNEQKDAVLLAGYLNLAMTYLKLNKPNEAITNCELALEMDPKNEKGLFRRGQALYMIKEYESAKKDFERVLALDAGNKAAKNQIIQCNAGMKAHLEKEKKTYRNMFSTFAHQDDLRERRAAKDVWKELADEEKRDFKSKDQNGVSASV